MKSKSKSAPQVESRKTTFRTEAGRVIIEGSLAGELKDYIERESEFDAISRSECVAVILGTLTGEKSKNFKCVEIVLPEVLLRWAEKEASEFESCLSVMIRDLLVYEMLRTERLYSALDERMPL